MVVVETPTHECTISTNIFENSDNVSHCATILAGDRLYEDVDYSRHHREEHGGARDGQDKTPNGTARERHAAGARLVCSNGVKHCNSRH